jgi:hypothetical protein
MREQQELNELDTAAAKKKTHSSSCAHNAARSTATNNIINNTIVARYERLTEDGGSQIEHQGTACVVMRETRAHPVPACVQPDRTEYSGVSGRHGDCTARTPNGT